MGRSRALPASMIASKRSRPCARSWLMRSTSTMALLTTMPASMMTPMNATMLIVVPVTNSARTAPTSARGIVNSMTKG